MTEYIQVTTAVGNGDDAIDMAKASVEARLAGCAQVLGPIFSAYWWRGRIESEQEWLVTMKTRRELYPELEAAIRRRHKYDVPEILATPVVAGDAEYLKWLEGELTPSG